MFNPDKIFAIITHVHSMLDKQETYNFYCDLEDSEYVELCKHFNIVEDGEFNNMKKFVFTKKIKHA